MKLMRWDCCSVAPSISCAGHQPYCPQPQSPPPPFQSLSFNPKDWECLTSQKSDPRGSLLLPEAPANLSPLQWGSIWKVRRDRRGGQGGLLWSIDMVTDRTVELSDFRGVTRLLFTSQIQAPLPQSHTLCMCCYISVSFSAFFFPSFGLLFPRTHRSRRLWCMHSWSWQSRSGNLWFTDPLLTYWFDLAFTFQRPGILTVQGQLRCNSACWRWKTIQNMQCLDWLICWMYVTDST